MATSIIETTYGDVFIQILETDDGYRLEWTDGVANYWGESYATLSVAVGRLAVLLDVTPPPRIATNGETITLNESGEWLDSLGRSGYYPHFGGGWICYTCGHLCECGESDE